MSETYVPSHIVVLFPESYYHGNGDSGKVPVIKALRLLTGYGLLHAKNLSECRTPQTIDISGGAHCVYAPEFRAEHIEEQCRTLRLYGCKVSPSIHKMMKTLREVARNATEAGEDDLADEILQIVLAQKLKRGI